MVPYLLFCFVVDHSLETCRKIYKVYHLHVRMGILIIHFRSPWHWLCGIKSGLNVRFIWVFPVHCSQRISQRFSLFAPTRSSTETYTFYGCLYALLEASSPISFTWTLLKCSVRDFARLSWATYAHTCSQSCPSRPLHMQVDFDAYMHVRCWHSVHRTVARVSLCPSPILLIFLVCFTVFRCRVIFTT